MKDRVQDELKQKYPEPEKEQDNSNVNEFISQLAWGLVILFGIALVDYLFF